MARIPKVDMCKVYMEQAQTKNPLQRKNASGILSFDFVQTVGISILPLGSDRVDSADKKDHDQTET